MSGGTESNLSTRSVTITALFAQLSLLVTTPLATRLVAQSDFSDYQVALSISAVLQPMLSGGIEYLLPAVAASKVRMLRMRGYRFLGFGAVLSGIAASVMLMSGSPRLAWLILGSAVIGLIYAYTALDSAYRANMGLLRILAARNITFGTAVIVFQVLVILLWPSFMGLVCAILAARIASLATSLVFNRRSGSTVERTGDGHDSVGRAAGLRQNFAWLAGVSVPTVAVQAPVLLMGFHSLELAGTFALALRIAGLPAAILGAAVSQGFALRLARMVRDGNPSRRIREMIVSVQRRWLCLGLGSSAVVALSAPFATPLLLGDDWGHAGSYIAVLAVPFGLQLVNRIVQPAYPLFGRNGTLVGLQALRLVGIVVITGTVLILAPDPLWAVVSVGVVSALSFIVSYVVTPTLVPSDGFGDAVPVTAPGMTVTGRASA